VREGPLEMSDVRIVGAAQSPYMRHPPRERDGEALLTETVLADAVVRVLEQAGFHRDDVDGLGVAAFTLIPDHAIDLAWRLGMRLRWLMEDTNGGACGPNLLQHAVRAIESGDAELIVLVAGDRVQNRDYDRLLDSYNRISRDYLAPLPFEGPNTLFSFLTQRHMAEYGMDRRDYGLVVVAQRWWAARNAGAVYRAPMTMSDYLGAPAVAPPLHRYDCVPPVTGADAVVVTSRERAGDRPAARVLAVGGSYNHDRQEGDGLSTGLRGIAADVWERAGVGPEDAGVVSTYDDYPVMSLIQLADMGFIADRDYKRWVRERLDSAPPWAHNTSGGQLSCGQAGAGGGMLGLVEIATQLMDRAGERQVNAHVGVAAGYGMVVLRWGAAANMAVLERVR
jgi:acetyl-CoA acetyltransferase